MNLRILFLALLFPLVGSAQNFPSKPLRFIVPYPPGGIGDTFTRALADPLASRLGQPVLVENKPGASQMIGAEAAAKSPGDGYTLFLSSISTLALAPFTIKSIPYDPLKDLAPVSFGFHTPLFLVVNPQVAAQNVAEIAQLAKQNPGKLTFATIGSGSSLHLAAELFKHIAGIDLFHVPYKGSAPAVADLLGGRVDLMFDAGTSSLPHVNAGKLRVLAVTGGKRSSFWPEVPTMQEAGVAGYDMTAWFGISAPGTTPLALREQLSAEIRPILAQGAMKERFQKFAMDLAGSTPQAFDDFIRAETKKWGEITRAAKIAPQ